MTALSTGDSAAAAQDAAEVNRQGLAGASTSNLWRPKAPDAVRKAWNVGEFDNAFTSWRRWLKQRDAADPFADLPKRAGPPSLWGTTNAPSVEPGWPFVAGGAAAVVREWLENPTPQNTDLRFALECVALADATPTLAEELDATDWWRLCDALLSIATEAAAATLSETPDAEEAVAHQLLAGELAYALVGALPELKPMHRLRGAAAAALSDGLERLCDGEGLTHANLLPRLPMLAACWTRCRLRADAFEKRPWSAGAETQFEWFVRQLLRLVDGDGRLPLEAEPTDGAAALVRLLVEEAGDEQDAAAAALRLKGFVADDDCDPPQASNHSEWAGVTVLASGWTNKSPRIVVTHAGRAVRLEIRANRRTLFAGDWPLDATRNGAAVKPVDDWDVSCWYSDEDCDYLELSIDLKGGGRLERMIVLGKQDGAAMLAEVLLTDQANDESLSIATRLPLGEGVRLTEAAETRELGIVAGGKPQGGVFPLALPEWRVEPGCGSLEESGGRLTHHVDGSGRNLAAPLWLDLAPKRFGKQRTWRRLTIAQSLERVPSDVAVGYRVQSGADQWLVYRSLDPPANRTLLGQNLASETLVGRFLKTGEVDEYFEIDNDE